MLNPEPDYLLWCRLNPERIVAIGCAAAVIIVWWLG